MERFSFHASTAFRNRESTSVIEHLQNELTLDRGEQRKERKETRRTTSTLATQMLLRQSNGGSSGSSSIRVHDRGAVLLLKLREWRGGLALAHGEGWVRGCGGGGGWAERGQGENLFGRERGRSKDAAINGKFRSGLV